MSLPENDDRSRDSSDQLHGWKEIAGYIGKGVRQAQRWEKLGMPIHRVGGMDGVVYAYRSELDAWRRSGGERDRASDEEVSPAERSAAPAESDAMRAAGVAHGRRWLRWAVLGALVLPLGIAFGYAYVSDRPLDISLQSPAAAPQGGSFRFEAVGGGDDLQLAHRVFRNPRGGELLVSPAVPRDPDGRFVWVYSTDCLTPPGQHEVFLADSDGAALTDSVRFEVREHAGCGGPVPDLQAISIDLITTGVEPGGTIKVAFVLSNKGAQAAYPSMTRLRLSRSALRSSITDIRLGDVQAPFLEPGDEASFQTEVRVPPDTPAGTYYVWIVLDNNGDNVEALTHNNYLKSVPLSVVSRSQ